MECVNMNLSEITKLLKEIAEQTTAIHEELEEIKGYGLCSSISDVCDKLDCIECSIAERDCK